MATKLQKWTRVNESLLIIGENSLPGKVIYFPISGNGQGVCSKYAFNPAGTQEVIPLTSHGTHNRVRVMPQNGRPKFLEMNLVTYMPEFRYDINGKVIPGARV